MRCLAKPSFILAGAGTLAIALLVAPAGPPSSHAADPPLAAPEPGLTYRVVNVSADDVLNVRDQPGTAAPVLATLPHDATGVAVTGVRQPVGAAMWWEVIHPGIERDRGWVNDLVPPAPSGVRIQNESSYRRSGDVYSGLLWASAVERCSGRSDRRQAVPALWLQSLVRSIGDGAGTAAGD